jgi:lipopolysaccharide transport system ATP-binding protein
MSSSDVAVSARGVSKSYKIAHEHGATTLGESIIKRIRQPLARSSYETFWALKDIDFDIKQGDVVGIIGRNGAGKSTLLKILSRITAPTTGEITIRGRVGSLLEVGTGFHPELTGRENIFLNGSILGMSRREIETRFDEIVDFSGVEQFLDTPVKRYSSGMYVRLAFSVAAHLDPEVMIVDEVLAVGDAEFQKKCLGKMQDVARSGRTVLFVSHNMGSVTTLCRTAIWLTKGHLEEVGDVKPVTSKYMSMLETETIDLNDHNRRAGSGDVRFVAVAPTQPSFDVGEDKKFRVSIKRQRPSQDPFKIMVAVGSLRYGTICYVDSAWNQAFYNSNDRLDLEITLSNLWLKAGSYNIDLFAKTGDTLLDWASPACRFDVADCYPFKQTTIDKDSVFGDTVCQFTVDEVNSL